MHPHLLLILDGYGIAEDPSVSAIAHARKPFLDHLFATYPHGTLRASERAVGLPVGQMGNSEVGHMNLGAGRVVYQDLVRIDEAIDDGSFFGNDVLVTAAQHAKTTGGKLHLFGLFSDGGVHSHLNHAVALLELARRQGLEGGDVLIHAFTDGRDTDPKEAGRRYIREVEAAAARTGTGRIADIVGRYYAMDRDKRWERTERAYRLLTEGVGEASFATAQGAVEAAYQEGETDEFITPRTIDGVDGRVRDGDAIIFFNFRADRARQITRALMDDAFDGFERRVRTRNLHYATFAQYDEAFALPVAFSKQNLTHTLGEAVAAQGVRQLRAAETEKYPHVTFFFSGGREEPFEGETRILVPSPKVATYDLQPEMSAPELSRRVAEALATEAYALAVVNFANPDMVGHTGDFDAAVRAIEAVDAATKTVVEAAQQAGYGITLIADHGNADCMKNQDGSPNTAHSLALVPHLIIKEGFTGPIRDGKLGDVAPTILALMGIDKPAEMTGDVLV